MTREWKDGDYVVTPHGDHGTIIGKVDVWYIIDHDPADETAGVELYDGDELCTSDEWAEQERAANTRGDAP